MKTVIRYVLSFILGITLIGYFLINLVSSTILSEQYVISQLEKNNYYDKTLEHVKSNFENYIYQSGLEEEDLENIITKEKIEKDTKIILNNLYNGSEAKIDTEGIRENLKKNINKKLGDKNYNVTQEKSVDTLINQICKEYENTVLHFSFENQINKEYVKITKYIDSIKKILLIAIGVDFLVLVVISLKRFYKCISLVGISLSITGLFLLIINGYVISKVRVELITILNDSISEILRNILTEILSLIMNYGIALLATGVILIISANLIHYVKKSIKQKNKRYVLKGEKRWKK